MSPLRREQSIVQALSQPPGGLRVGVRLSEGASSRRPRAREQVGSQPVVGRIVCGRGRRRARQSVSLRRRNSQVHNNNGDIIARAAVYSSASEHRGGDARSRLAAGSALACASQAPLGQGACLLVGQHIPEPIARQQQDLVVRPPAQNGYL